MKNSTLRRISKKLVVYLFAIVTINGFSQTWCAPGAEWHYRVYNPMTFNYQDGYLKVQVVGTTTTGGIAYHNLSIGYYGINNSPNSPTVASSYGTIYTYEQNSVIYASMINTMSYDTIANFNALIGDKWRITRDNPNTSFPNCPTVIPHLTVLDTGHVVINGQNLKTLLLSPSNSPTYTYTMIEKIGSINGFMFAYYTCLVDGWSTGDFVCYSDNNFQLYKKPGYTLPCDFSLWGTVVAEELITENSKITVYPNPANNYIQVDIKHPSLSKDCSVKIKDALGQALIVDKLGPSKEIDIKQLKPGIYFIEIYSKEQQLLQRQKLLKQNH